MAQKDCVKSHARKEAFILPQTCPEIWRVSNFDRHAPEAGHYGVFLHPIQMPRCMGSNKAEKKAKHPPGASLGPWGKSARNPALGVDLSKVNGLCAWEPGRTMTTPCESGLYWLCKFQSSWLARKNSCGCEHQTEIVYGPAYRIVRQLSFLAYPSDFQDKNLNLHE